MSRCRRQTPLGGDIPGAKNYQANIDTGDIRSLDHVCNGQRRRGRILKLTVGNHGYCVCNVKIGGKFRTELAHRLVYAAARGKIRKGFDISHLSGAKIENAISKSVGREQGRAFSACSNLG